MILGRTGDWGASMAEIGCQAEIHPLLALGWMSGHLGNWGCGFRPHFLELHVKYYLGKSVSEHSIGNCVNDS